ncbi:MAG: aminomethyl-transferring glycine dehydrogenase subunit GcvPB [Bacilli bacterium]|nr:aminomethyl-transferring glycine dehydrogenase subunit GcvPB [Bacilli bacterium]MBN2877124.1 aminomethyl-transferring glycine dehydrogenase subunit GcvPB [Bacilli bacterium]
MKYDKLIFELSSPGRVGYSLPKPQYPKYSISDLQNHLRTTDAVLPEVSELDCVRHYTNISHKNHGVETGFYPLGSCTMKYNPKINEEIAKTFSFPRLHPYQPVSTIQGALRMYHELQDSLAKISGLSEFTLNSYAGAHGELVGLMIMKQYHHFNKDFMRNKVIIPDSAHGTNPASTTVSGMEVIEIESNDQGMVDLDALKAVLSDEIAGMMLTNPNTLGIFEKDIQEITRLVHEAGGLMYYDGANLNAMLGKVRPGDMGFDIMHINLHKTFSTPHGGGGPGSGPVGVKDFLVKFLPNPTIKKLDDYYYISNEADAIGQISGFFGNYLVELRAYSYILNLGKENLMNVGPYSVLNANYIREKLRKNYELPIQDFCMHEVVFDGLKHNPNEIRTLDVAKRLLDYGMHAPTIYFPLLFHQSIMIEPTETESLQTIDHFIETMNQIAEEAKTDPDTLRNAPLTTPISRTDEVFAAKQMIFTYKDYLEYIERGE